MRLGKAEIHAKVFIKLQEVNTKTVVTDFFKELKRISKLGRLITIQITELRKTELNDLLDVFHSFYSK